MRRRIFEPLDLDATTYPLSETTIEGRHAHGYLLLGPPPLIDVTAFSPSIAGAGGAIVSTVGDVARLLPRTLQGPPASSGPPQSYEDDDSLRQ